MCWYQSKKEKSTNQIDKTGRSDGYKKCINNFKSSLVEHSTSVDVRERVVVHDTRVVHVGQVVALLVDHELLQIGVRVDDTARTVGRRGRQVEVLGEVGGQALDL